MGATARADTLWIGGAAGGGGGIEMKGVQVQEVRDGKILFATSSGSGGVRDVKQIARVMADNEPALNAAEEALAKNQLDVATENFRKALGSSAKEWVKVWSAQRLTQVAPRANRFDAAASGYIALLAREPGRATEFKPVLPSGQSTFLTSAINEATVALGTPNLAPAAKEALSAFIAELQQAKGAPAGAGGAGAGAGTGVVQTAQAAQGGQSPMAGQTGAASGGQAPPSVAAAAADAAASAANQKLARQKLDAANAALERKDYPAAINEIRSNAKIFTEPRDQAQALYFIAEAQTGIARAKNDVPSWQDAALGYMRVVAHFHDPPVPEPVRPFVARSMLKAAQIQETVRDPAAARALYEQLSKEFPADPAAKDAAAALARLQSKT
jgi:TolA-binding protein